MRGISLFVQWLRLYSQCRGPGFNPWSRNAKKPKKKKKKKERKKFNDKNITRNYFMEKCRCENGKDIF